MKQSKFNNLIIPDKSQQQHLVLYNSFHDHRVSIENLDNSVVNFFKKIDQREELSEEEQEYAKVFYEMGIILDDDFDEAKLFDDWYQDKIRDPKGMLNLTLVTSMACNLRCPYCYEKEQLDQKRKMSMDMVPHFVHWVKEEIEKRAVEVVEIIFYGGEPLTNAKVVIMTSRLLQAICREKGIEYRGKMVTNGVLMKPALAKEIRRAGIRKVKVTLDGVKETHDTTRITSSGKGSFDQIWYNLEHANDDLEEGEPPMYFLIGGNFKAETYPGFFPLLKQLALSKFNKYIKELNFKPVQDFTISEKENLSPNPCDTVCFNTANIDRMLHLRKEMTARGLKPIDGLNLGPCDFYRGDAMTIGLDGRIYPCIAFVDNEKLAIGHITEHQNKTEYAETYKKWEKTKSWSEDCYGCNFLPVCVGGCRATAYSNGFDWNSPVCEKEYFQKMSVVMADEMQDAELEEVVVEAGLDANLSNASGHNCQSGHSCACHQEKTQPHHQHASYILEGGIEV